MNSPFQSAHPDESPAGRDTSAASLAAMTLLHDISTRFVQEGNTRSLFEQAVAAALEITGADMGNIQVLDESSGQLQVVACRNLGVSLPACCLQVDKRLAACGIAVRQAERLIIDDVAHSPILARSPWRDALLAEGMASVQVTPLFTRSGRLAGVLSTHCRKPRQLPENGLRLLDMLARQIADIIERSQANEALRASTERYRSLFENMLDGYAHARMLVVDGVPVDFEFLAVNQAFERLTGLKGVVGKKASHLIPGIRQDNPELFLIYGRVAETGEPVRFETYLAGLDVWVAVAAYRPAEGEVAAVFDNISERKRLEKELQQRREEMESLVKHQVAAQTAAAIAHDLNQPLVAISAYSEVALRALQGGVAQGEKLIRALEGCVQQAQRAGYKLHELLDFLHHGDIVSIPMNLADTIKEAVTQAKGEGWGGFLPALDLERGLPLVLGNHVQVQKVLDNLLRNAAEAMDGNGTPDAAIAIEAKVQKEGALVQVTVRDSGPGLPTEMADRVFEPFFTTKARGIGLGLAISRTLIEAHGGRLWAEFHGGPGAIFHFTLPVAE